MASAPAFDAPGRSEPDIWREITALTAQKAGIGARIAELYRELATARGTAGREEVRGFGHPAGMMEFMFVETRPNRGGLRGRFALPTDASWRADMKEYPVAIHLGATHEPVLLSLSGNPSGTLTFTCGDEVRNSPPGVERRLVADRRGFVSFYASPSSPAWGKASLRLFCVAAGPDDDICNVSIPYDPYFDAPLTPMRFSFTLTGPPPASRVLTGRFIIHRELKEAEEFPFVIDDEDDAYGWTSKREVMFIDDIGEVPSMSTDAGVVEKMITGRGGTIEFETPEAFEPDWIMEARFVSPANDFWEAPPARSMDDPFIPVMHFKYTSLTAIEGELTLPIKQMKDDTDFPLVLSGYPGAEGSLDKDDGTIWFKRDGFDDYLCSPEECHRFLIRHRGGKAKFVNKGHGDVNLSFIIAPPPLRYQPSSWVSPRCSWNEVLLAWTRGSVSQAIRRASRSIDVLRTIHSFIRFEPDWSELETALRREIDCGQFHPNPQVTVSEYVSEYKKFLKLHALGPDTLALPVFCDRVTRGRPIDNIWKLHIASSSYSEDCRLVVGRVVYPNPPMIGLDDFTDSTYWTLADAYRVTCALYRETYKPNRFEIESAAAIKACWPGLMPDDHHPQFSLADTHVFEGADFDVHFDSSEDEFDQAVDDY